MIGLAPTASSVTGHPLDPRSVDYRRYEAYVTNRVQSFVDELHRDIPGREWERVCARSTAVSPCGFRVLESVTLRRCQVSSRCNAMRLDLARSAGSVTVHQEDGATVTFTPSSTGYTAPPRVVATLVKNSNGSFSFVRDARETMTFSAAGQLTTMRDLNNYTTSLAYGGSGHLATVTDPAGRQLAFGFTGSRITKISDPAGRSVTFAYDSNGNLTDVGDVKGGVSHSTYDANHLLLTMTDPNGNVVTNKFDGVGRITAQTDARGKSTGFGYSGDNFSAAGGSTTTTHPNGNISLEQYSQGRRTSRTEGKGSPNAATWTYTYEPNTLGIATSTDPNGHTTVSTYDASANLLTVTDPLGRKTTNTYDNLNDALSTTDPQGVATIRTYDARGNRTSESRPLRGTPSVQTMAYTYADNHHPGDVTSTTDPAGKVTTLTYDANGNLASRTDPLGDTTTYTYDAIGRQLTVTSPKGNLAHGTATAFTTTSTYDNFGDVLSVTDPLGHTRVNTYDGDRNLITSTDPNRQKTSYTYDADNETTRVARADGTSLGTTYDPNGNKVSQTDGSGATTTYGYDALDRETSVTDALGRTTTGTYDGTGNKTSTSNPAGQTTTYAYDAANQLNAIRYSDGKTPNVANITYDADGQRTGQTDGSGTWAWTWDSLHRLTSVTEGVSGTVAYKYDLRNLVAQIAYPGGNAVSRVYDDAGRWTGVKDWLGNATTFTYDPNSNLVGQASPAATSVKDSYGFDNADAQVSTSARRGATTLFAANYTRDNNNQLASDSSTPASTGSYGYTALNQLCYAGSASGKSCGGPPSGAASYRYDKADNLTGNGGITQSFDTANQLCWTLDGPSTNSCGNPPSGASVFTYDSRGDRTNLKPANGQPSTFGYDQANRLTSAETQATQPAYAPTVLSDKPDSYWRFGDSSGLTARDSSGHGHNGSYGLFGQGVPKLGAPGLLAGDPDTAITLDGTNGVWLLNPPRPKSSFSLEAWIRPTKTSNEQTVFAVVGRKLQSRLSLNISTSGELVLRFGGTVLRTPAGAIAFGSISHVAVTYDARLR